MSTAQDQDTPPRPRNYAPGTGTNRYVRFVEDWLDVRLGLVQRRLLESLEQHRRTICVTANGIGKSYGGGACGGIAATYCNPDTTCNITSGSYGQLDDTIWKPVKSLHRQSDLPGRTLDNTRELRTSLDENWYLKCLSPKYPADLEGRHNRRMVYIIEEADKPGITAEHIDSAESTLTDAGDRMLVIANPPKDESNVVYQLMESDDWHTLQFSSFQSENVRAEIETDIEPIHGLVSLDEIRQNWTDWNGEIWPGLEAAETAHDRRDDLDERWYRRRAGIMPPGKVGTYRPLDPDLVDAAYEPGATPTRNSPTALGVDVARAGDNTVAAGLRDDDAVIEYAATGTDHTEQEQRLAELIREWPIPDIAVDAVGEGSGLADGLDDRFGTVHRFKNQATAADATTYEDKWAESLALFAEWLEAGGTIADADLYEQAKVAARIVAWEERHIGSRGEHGADVLRATARKEDVKHRLGRSPDHLDATLMAVWRDRADTTDDRRASPTFSF